MSNISLVEKAFEKENKISVPRYLTCGGRNFAEHEGEIWRAYEYIERKRGYSCYEHGFAVGRFLRVVNSANIEFEMTADVHKFSDINLPKRNIHGDTKTDNIIFGEKTTIIDFDTAMQGYVFVDYGDMIRSITSKEVNLQAIREATEGFAAGIGNLLTDDEIKNLYSGIILIITELTERYHSGTRNFPNKTYEQCLEREKELILQLEKIHEHECEIRKIINECFA